MPIFPTVFAILGVFLMVDATARLLVPRFVPESTGVRIFECFVGMMLAIGGGLVLLGDVLA